MRKIHHIANVLSALGLNTAFLKARQFFVKDIPILAYHRIRDIDNQEDYPFDVALISTSESDFYWQMQYIKDNFTPIPLSLLCEFIDGKATLPANPIVVTFDDGFDDNYHIAFPILKKLNIPATLFVASSFVEEERTIWYERLAHFLLGANNAIKIPELQLEFPATDNLKQRRGYYSELVEKLKVTPNHKRVKILDELYTRYNENYLATDAKIRDLSKPVSWQQLKEMSASVFEIGSHSVTHPVLTMLTDEELAFELEESKRILESKLGTQIDTIAYPVGMHFAFDTRIRQATLKAGYKIGLSYMPGRNTPHSLDNYGLCRMHIDWDMPRNTFAAKLAVPSFFND